MDVIKAFAQNFTFLKEAKDFLRTHWHQGVDCPCCGQYVKLYRRKLNSQMATFLGKLVVKYLRDPRWYHARELCAKGSTKASSDGTYLVHWGFIQSCPKDDTTVQKTSGLWRPTPSGIDFVLKKTTAPKYMFLFDNKAFQSQDPVPQVQFYECLTDKFIYHELMDHIAPTNQKHLPF